MSGGRKVSRRVNGSDFTVAIARYEFVVDEETGRLTIFDSIGGFEVDKEVGVGAKVTMC